MIVLALYNMGGPKGIPDVEPFLNELFRDNDLLAVPKLLQNTIAQQIVKRRLHEVQKKYEEIGGGSPQGTITEKLCAKLSNLLPGDVFRKVTPLFRYCSPRASDLIAECARNGDELWLLSQYPHCSRPTTGSSLKDIARAAKGKNVQVKNLSAYYDDPGFIELWVKRMTEFVRPGEIIVASAHNIPKSFAAEGDPYPQHIYRTAREVMRRIGKEENVDWYLTWQSAVGPVAWLSPDTRDIIRECAQKGQKRICLWPVAFVSDHIETLHEVDIEFAELAEHAGIESFRRVPNLNDNDDFAAFCAQKVLQALENPGVYRLRIPTQEGEGCSRQPGGCLCARYYQTGISQ